MNPTECIKEHLDELREKYMVSRIGIFGSFARGDLHEFSDIDILVEFTQPVGLFRFVELQTHLSEMIGREVDIGEPEALKPLIRGRVLKEVIWI